jgi:hypothetical protein
MLKRMRPRKRLVTGMMKMRTGGLTGPLKEGPNSPEKLVVVKHNEYFGYAKQYRRLYCLTRLCEMEPGQDPAILSTRRTGAIAKEEAPPKRMGGASVSPTPLERRYSRPLFDPLRRVNGPMSAV